MRTKSGLALLAGLFALVARDAGAQPLYDIDFEAPLHISGEEPTLASVAPGRGPTNAARTRVIETGIFGSQQALEIQNLPLQLSRESFELAGLSQGPGLANPPLLLEFDFFVEVLDPVFDAAGLRETFYIDAGNESIVFTGAEVFAFEDAHTRVLDPNETGLTYGFRRLQHFELRGGSLGWRFLLDGQLLASSTVPVVMDAFVIGITEPLGDPRGTRVFLDNVRVATVPEPDTANLIVAGLALLGGRAASRRTCPSGAAGKQT